MGIDFNGNEGRLKRATTMRSNQWCLVSGIWVVVEGVLWFWEEL